MAWPVLCGSDMLLAKAGILREKTENGRLKDRTRRRDRERKKGEIHFK